MVLIITGTIEPVKQDKLVVQDSKVRLEQYLACIRYYIEQDGIQKIVFCDNSNYEDAELLLIKDNLQLHAQKNRKELEWLSFQGDSSAVQTYGKGYGEGEIMEYVMAHSELMKSEDYFVKVTGRLVVDNLGQIVRVLDKRNKKKQLCYINIPNRTRRDIYDTRIYAMSKELFQTYFQKAYKKVNDGQGHFLEHVYKDVIQTNKIASRNFPLYPRIRGISGSSGGEYVYTEWKCKIKDLQSKCNYFGIVH
ncbi:MAG: hypothetical protein ACI4DU_09120 [Lachnospiraceae bacterium]